MSKLKIGGCYEGKGDTEGGWYICTGIGKDYYKGRFCYVDEGGSDEEIQDVLFTQVEALIDTSVCYVPRYHKQFGLYRLDDESKNPTVKIALQKYAR